jgi:hypothetical protein
MTKKHLWDLFVLRGVKKVVGRGPDGWTATLRERVAGVRSIRIGVEYSNDSADSVERVVCTSAGGLKKMVWPEIIEVWGGGGVVAPLGWVLDDKISRGSGTGDKSGIIMIRDGRVWDIEDHEVRIGDKMEVFNRSQEIVKGADLRPIRYMVGGGHRVVITGVVEIWAARRAAACGASVRLLPAERL